MKKIFIVLLLFVFVWGLFGCGQQNKPEKLDKKQFIEVTVEMTCQKSHNPSVTKEEQAKKMAELAKKHNIKTEDFAAAYLKSIDYVNTDQALRAEIKDKLIKQNCTANL